MILAVLPVARSSGRRAAHCRVPGAPLLFVAKKAGLRPTRSDVEQGILMHWDGVGVCAKLGSEHGY
jgi:hypothetical protein